MTFRSLLLPPLLVAAGASAGCAEDARSGTSGAMQQSTTTSDCAPGDVACQEDGLDAPLAIGARLPLDVHITARGVASPKVHLEAAREDVLGIEDGTLVGLASGWSSVLFVGEEGLVLDFVTMSVEQPERLAIYRLADGGGVEASALPDKIQIAPGDDFEIAVKAFAGPVRLLGELEAAWSLDHPVVTVLDSGRPASRRLRAKELGTATLTVEAAGFSKTLEMEVLP